MNKKAKEYIKNREEIIKKYGEEKALRFDKLIDIE